MIDAPFQNVNQSVDAVDGPKDGDSALFGLSFLTYSFRKLIASYHSFETS
jgi:hypothetical protein